MESKILGAATLVDTDILIDVSRQASDAIAVLERMEGQSIMAISVITQMELIVGCRNKTELWKTDRFLKRFEIVTLNEPISDRAIELLRQYRLSHGLAIPNALIAATALVCGRNFVTKNQRDYRFISGLCLLPYPGPSNS